MIIDIIRDIIMSYGGFLWKPALIYLAVMNILDFALMGLDKQKAKKEKWRIPEKRFFLIALLGGSLGAWIGMRFFHHKTMHWYFKWGLPLIFFVQVIGCLLLGYYVFL